MDNNNNNLIPLPRGGYLVKTSIGHIQFGSPPETIKDTMLMECGVPSIFILPFEHFDPEAGISMAEIEFPIYYNFFLRNKKVHIFVNPDHINNLKIVLQEAIFGPVDLDISNEVEMDSEDTVIPDLMSEMKHFRNNRKLEDLVDIRAIPPTGFKIENVTVVPLKDHGFHVYDGKDLLAEIPAKLKFKIRYDLGKTLNEPFIPPEFGITCLGPSHGFDPSQNTSGFLLWINKVGIMVDPPVNSTQWLRDSNVNPKLIDSVILTHCHADHDSGTFQKILEETKINIYTTPTIMQSFIRKYSALTRIPVSTLLAMFHFHPLKINAQFNIHGALFSFFYTLHSIPTIGFHFSYRNKSFLYSSDHLNDPDTIRKLHELGVISEARMKQLFDFPWDTDIIYHEAGIPPLHTPVKYLDSLPDNVKNRLTIYHIASKDFPKESKLKLAKFGIGETLYPEIEKHKLEDAYEILDVFSRIDIFKDLPFERTKDLMLVVNKETFNKGDKIIRKDTVGDKFYVIVSGNVAIEGIANVNNKVYGTYEYFGEVSLVLNTKRTADVVAVTNVESFSIEKQSFLRLIRNTSVEKYIRTLASVRDAVSWNVIKTNSYFGDLSSSQVTQLESMLEPVEKNAGEIILNEGEYYTDLWLFATGEVQVFKKDTFIRTCSKGDFIGNFFMIKDRKPADFTYKAVSKSSLFKMKAQSMADFLSANPGVHMKMMFDEKNR